MPKTADEYADAVITAIRTEMARDPAWGTEVRGIRSFSQLHDYCDANMFVIDALGADYAPDDFPCEACGAPSGPWNRYGNDELECDHCGDVITGNVADIARADAESDMANAVMDEADRRIRAGALQPAQVVAMFTPGGAYLHKSRECLGRAKNSPFAKDIDMPPAVDLIYDTGHDKCCYCGALLASLPAGVICPEAAGMGMDDQEHVPADFFDGFYVSECLR